MSQGRDKLLGDAEYFAGQLIRCYEALADRDTVSHRRDDWRQAAAITRRMRAFNRNVIDRERRRRKLLARRA